MKYKVPDWEHAEDDVVVMAIPSKMRIKELILDLRSRELQIGYTEVKRGPKGRYKKK